MEEGKHYLDTISWGVITWVNYRGVLVERALGNGFTVFEKTVKTGEDVDNLIEAANLWLGKSIEK